jgi:hypothetical protein
MENQDINYRQDTIGHYIQYGNLGTRFYFHPGNRGEVSIARQNAIDEATTALVHQLYFDRFRRNAPM